MGRGGAPSRLWQAACWDSAQQDLRCAGNNILYHWWQAAARQGRPAACGKIKPFGQTCMQPTRKYVRRRCSRRVAAPTEPTLCLLGLLPCAGLCSHYVLGCASCAPTMCLVVLLRAKQGTSTDQPAYEGGNPTQSNYEISFL